MFDHGEWIEHSVDRRQGVDIAHTERNPDDHLRGRELLDRRRFRIGKIPNNRMPLRLEEGNDLWGEPCIVGESRGSFFTSPVDAE
jgi:hypothetical protein